MQLIAIEEFEYNNKSLKRGDKFEAPPLHAQLLIHGGRAKDAKDNETEKIIQTAAVKATEEIPSQPMNRRHYKRRDMRAEE